MKSIALAALLTIAPAPAFASSVQRQAEAGALAYCAARAAGKTDAQATRAFSDATVNAAGFGSFFNMGQTREQGAFLVRQMCPQYL